MKKKFLNLKLVIIVLTLFTGINKVNATRALHDKFAIDGIHGYTGSHWTYSGNYEDFLYGSDAEHSNYKYKAIVYSMTNSNNSNDKHVAYCIDPNGNTPRPHEIEISRILTTTDDKGQYLVDKALTAILKNGYNNYTTASDIPSGLTADDFYLATSLAVRAFNMGVNFSGIGKVDDAGLAEATIKLGVQWFSQLDKETFDVVKYAHWLWQWGLDYDEIIDYITSPGSLTHYDGFTGSQFTVDENQKVYKVAKELFLKGVEAILEETSTEEPNVEVSKIYVDNNYIKFSFNIENFAEDGFVHVSNLNCPDCQANGITIEAGEVGYEGNWNSFNTSLDVSEYVNNNGEVWVRFPYTKNEVDDCQDVNFSIDYTLNYGSNFGAKWQAYEAKKDTGGTQRFLMIEKEGDEGKDITNTLSGSIKCSKAACETTINTPTCSNNKDDAVASIEGPKDIKKCILENHDDAKTENTYQLETQTNVVGNDYCGVFCKEDYEEIRYNPIIDNINCGGWFKLTVDIKGKKSCYTAGNKAKDYAIDKEQFDNDIKEIQTNLADALTNFNKYQAWVDATIPEATPTTKTCGDNTCGTEYSYIIEIKDYQKYKVDSTGKVIKEDGKEDEKYTFRTACPACKTSVSFSDGKWFTSSSCGAGTCPASTSASNSELGLTISNFKTYATQQRDYYSGLIENYTDQLNKAINDYNACTTAWTNEYKFDQKLKYQYTQNFDSDSEMIETNLKDSYYGLLDENQKELVPVNDEAETEITIQACKGNTDKEYETCSTGWITIEGEDSLGDYNYSDNYSSVFDSGTGFTFCNLSGTNISCENKNVRLSEAKFVRKVVGKAQEYETPTTMSQVDTTGLITTNGDYRGSEVNLSEIENGLAVSTKNIGGGITNIVIYDLGEYYGNSGDKLAGESGRLIDFDDNGKLIESTVAYAKEDVWDSSVGKGEIGEYYCMYKTNCRSPKCPSCDWDCVPGTDPNDPVICEWEECPGCTLKCVNCVFDLGELQLNFKNISPNKFNNVDRELGYNWNVSTTLSALELLRLKASSTILEIERDNETIYNSGDKTGGGSNLAFSIRMTPEVTSYIKNVNEDINSQNIGGYANDSLTCYNDETNGFKNIYCFSSFIDDLVKNYNADGLINGLNNRTEIGVRSSDPNQNGYWTLWIAGNEGVTGGYVVPTCDKDDEDYPNCHINQIGGPAWK